MSYFGGLDDPNPGDAPACDAIEQMIIPSSRDIGGFSVKRALPTARRRMVGPFIFFDRMGPAILRGGEAMDVRPHPHIGLSTVTYLFDGAIRHRDSLGTEMVIKPGDVNLMTAGRGIVHSERSPEEMRGGEMPMSGLQTWLALPDHLEEIDPAFSHIATSELPEISDAGIRARVVMGGSAGSHRRCRSTPARSMST
jgi:redox-sensitive bicupin YhaK (pirin superfamily)